METINRDITYKSLLDVVYNSLDVDRVKFDLELRTSLEGEGRIVHPKIKGDNDLVSMKNVITKVPIIYVTLVKVFSHSESDDDDDDYDYNMDDENDNEDYYDYNDVDDIFGDIDSELGGNRRVETQWDVGDEEVEDIGGGVDGNFGGEVGEDLFGESEGHLGSDEFRFNWSSQPASMPNTGCTENRQDTDQPFNIPGADDYSLFASTNEELTTPSGPFSKGMIFTSKNELKNAFLLYALKDKFECRTIRSNQKEYVVGCKDRTCKLYFRVARMQNCDY